MAECFLLLFMRYLFNVFIWNLKSHMGSVGGVWDGKARKSHSSSTAGTCDMESDCQTGNKRVFPGPFPAELQPACLPLFPLSLPLHEGFPFPSGGGPLLSAVSPPLPLLTLPWAPVLHTQVSARILDPWLQEGKSCTLFVVVWPSHRDSSLNEKN